MVVYLCMKYVKYMYKSHIASSPLIVNEGLYRSKSVPYLISRKDISTQIGYLTRFKNRRYLSSIYWTVKKKQASVDTQHLFLNPINHPCLSSLTVSRNVYKCLSKQGKDISCQKTTILLLQSVNNLHSVSI